MAVAIATMAMGSAGMAMSSAGMAMSSVCVVVGMKLGRRAHGDLVGTLAGPGVIGHRLG